MIRGLTSEPGVAGVVAQVEVRKERPRDIIRSLLEAKVAVTKLAAQLIDAAFRLLSEEDVGRWEVVAITPRHLGVLGVPDLEEILEAGQERGWRPCPPMVAPALRLLWRGSDRLFVAHDPVEVEGSSYLFSLRISWRTRLPALDGVPADLNQQWDKDRFFGFCLPPPRPQ